MKIFILFFALLTMRSAAQSVEDSLRIVDPNNWRLISQSGGVVCRTYTSSRSGPLFNTAQRIFVVEIDTSQCMLALDQFAVRKKVSSAAKRSPLDPVVAVNGGFFTMGIREAVPADFISVQGVEYPSQAGWSSALFAYDRPSSQLYIGDRAGHEQPWSDMMVAGPLLLGGGRTLLTWVERDPVSQYDKRQIHDIFAPRTAVGVRADGRVLLIVVDGRRTNSFGMSLEWLAVTGRWLGLCDMINFDGGGSSTLWLRKEGVVNSPSDGKSFIHLQRKVANALLVAPR